MNPNSRKVVIIGDSTVGKSSIVQRLMHNNFQHITNSTVGASFCCYRVKVPGDREVSLGLWDTAGQERYRTLLPMYLRDAHAIILVYDVTNIDSFNSATTSWMKYLNDNQHSYPKDTIKIFVANKIDLAHTRDVVNRGQDFASENNMRFYTTSAARNIGINFMFQDLINTFADRQTSEDDKPKDTVELKDPQVKVRSKCSC